MWILAGEATAARLTSQLRRRGIDSLLLKGVATERWLYSADDRRISGDIDILVPPDRIVDAEQTLADLGYVSRFDGPAPSWVDQHGHAWTSASEILPVDLHRRIWGFRADPAEVWRQLWSSRTQLMLAGQPVDVLGPATRAMLAATHVAQHEGKVGSVLEDLRRALAQDPLATWSEAAQAAARCGAISAFVDGLAALPEGRRVKDRLGLPDADPAEHPAPPEVEGMSAGGEGILRLTRAHGLRERFSVARQEVFPSVRFMRVRSLQAGLARRGPLGLLASYPARWLFILRSLARSRRHRP